MPGWRDPRWGQVLVLATFTVLGQTVLGFGVSPAQIATAVGVAVGLDTLLLRRREGSWAVPLSATISGLSIGLLLRSPDLPVFVLASAVAIGSKHLVRTRQGRHVFNPSNVGIVVALALTSGLSEVTPGQWGTSAVLALGVCCAGAFIVFRVQRLVLVATFLAAHVVAAIAYAGRVPPWSSTLTASILIFTFFMITDPRTAPSSRLGQVGYALAVAGLAQVFVATGSMAAPFLALVVVCPFVPSIDRLVAQRGATATRPAGAPVPA